MKNYIIEKTLGEGSQGSVLLARDKKIGRLVAIKSLHPNLILDDIQRDRFIEEIKILDELKGHSSIVNLYHYDADGDNYNMYMEYFKGVPLDEYIKNTSGPIAEINAIDIFIQVLEGIDFMHNKDIIHRDIKPSNILINESNKIKLIDFGISKNNQVDSKLTIIGNGVGGTPMYMSPEHTLNETITNKSDIYSLGVTLWQMLTGVAPYENMSLPVIYNKITNEPLIDIQKVYGHVSSKMNEIVQTATSKNPDERYDSCRSFIEALSQLKKYLKDANKATEIKKKKIDINVKNVNDARIFINSKEYIPEKINFLFLNEQLLNIKIEKEGYQPYINEIKITEDITLNVTLKNDKPSPLSIFKGIYVLITLLSHKTIYAFITSKYSKESATNILIRKQKIEASKQKFDANLVEIKKAKIDLAIYILSFIIILMVFIYYKNYVGNQNETKPPKETKKAPSPNDINVPEKVVNEVTKPTIKPQIDEKGEIIDKKPRIKTPIDDKKPPTIVRKPIANPKSPEDFRDAKVDENKPDKYTDVFDNYYYALIFGETSPRIQIFKNNISIGNYNLSGKINTLYIKNGILYSNKQNNFTVRKHYIDYRNKIVHTSDATSITRKLSQDDKYKVPENAREITIHSR